MIAIWSGALVDIPDGWVLCDGNNGTPDLVTKFIRGAGPGFDVGDQGGDTNHQHFFTSNTHFHTFPGGAIIDAGNDLSRNTTGVAVTGQTNETLAMPPYYTLAYIMKT